MAPATCAMMTTTMMVFSTLMTIARASAIPGRMMPIAMPWVIHATPARIRCRALPSSVTLEVATGGDLGLNNSGDTVTLTGAQGIALDVFDYGAEGGNDQSVVRQPELDTDAAGVAHLGAAGATAEMSPGTLANGADFDEAGPVPTGDTGTTTAPPGPPATRAS